MSNVEEFPRAARTISEYAALVGAGRAALDAIPGAVYLCDRDGWLVGYNGEAERLWGRTPEPNERFCGSLSLLLPDGRPLPPAECPMAKTVVTGEPARNAEVLIERPDGTRVLALVNIRALRDLHGNIEGAINCFQDVTDHRRIEEEARHKDADLRDFFENGAIALHVVSSDGIIQRANKAELDLLGYASDEYVGRHIAEFHADAPAVGDILHKLAGGERIDRYPARLRAKDGSIRHVLITSNSRFENGKFVNTRCFTTDITALVEAENARRETEERLAATYEAATVGIAEADEKGRLLRVNDATCRMLGRSREDLLSLSFFDYTDDGDREEDERLYAQQVRGEIENYVLRKRARRPDGTIVYLDVHSSSVRDARGAFRHGVRVIQDVTYAKQTEDRLRDSEHHLRSLLEALPAAVYTTDAEGRINFFNKAAVEMSGRTPQAGDMWCVTWRLYNTDGTPLPHDQCPMAIALREDRPVRGVEAVAERPDRTRVPFIPYPTPLHDADGKLVGAINMLVDITERKQAENRQKVLIDELNHRVKNTLATVQSLAAQTTRQSVSPTDFYQRFESRLLALARAHDLLTRRRWEDAPLDALAREVLTPHAGDAAQRISVSGPAVPLTPNVALSLTMTLNELATNAVKYGALSKDTGQVSVSWTIADNEAGPPHLTIAWSEMGGPPVTPPARRGMGTRLMEMSIERDLGGDFDLNYAPGGLIAKFTVPLGLPFA